MFGLVFLRSFGQIELIGLFPPITLTSFRTVFDFIPIFFPLLSPGKWTITNNAYFTWQMLLFHVQRTKIKEKGLLELIIIFVPFLITKVLFLKILFQSFSQINSGLIGKADQHPKNIRHFISQVFSFI